MGLAIKEILVSKEIEVADLKGKILAIDSFNLLYQFLTTIRSPDGSLLTDRSGNVTSHLIGLFSRTTNFMEQDLKPIFVFDGEAPKLKKQERERRAQIKQEAKREYEIAKEREDIDAMKKYASRTTKLTSEMIEDAKQLIGLLGLPIVQAASEGEAQAAYLAREKDAYACVSQDFDSLLYATPFLVRNLSIAGKRKKTNKLGFVTVKPELYSYQDNLQHLGLTQDQLIVLSMLVGTDYNIGGIKGIGPKKAITLVKEHKSDFDKLFAAAKWKEYFDYDWQQVFDVFKNMPVNKNYSLKFTSPKSDKIMEFLCDKHDFERERIERSLNKLSQTNDMKQKGLGDFF